MDGVYKGLPDVPRSVLGVTADDLSSGRARALAQWNAFETDIDGALPQKSRSVSGVATSMVEDAAYAYAIIAAANRIDGVNATVQASGVAPQISQQVSRALPAALEHVREYAKWVSETKTRMAIIGMGV